MALVSVTADNDRVDDAENITGVSSRGGGAGAAAEAPLAYQGSLAWNRKVTSSTGAGFQYAPTSDSGTARDMTATGRRHWMVKHAVSDFPGLRANDGLRVYIGDGSAEYAYITAGSDAIKSAYSEYLLRTATLIIPVSPNVAGYRDATHSGSGVTGTAIDMFGIEAEFASSSAKSENVALDAVDVGAGLDLVGGDGADPDGVWADFVDEDEGTAANRWGYANSIYGTSGVLVFFGRMRIGSSGAATVFTDATGNCLWPDGLYEAGFSRVEIDLQNAGTVVTEGATHTSLGTTNVEDTRLDYAVIGTAGTATISGTKNNLRNVILTSAATVDGANIQCADLTQAGATIQSAATIRCTSASGVAVCDDFTPADASDVTFVQAGSGHAIEITAPGSYTFTNLSFSGFGGTPGTNSTPASGANDAAIYNNSGGAVTINVSGGDSPSVRNGASATTTVSASVPVQVTVTFGGSPVPGAAVYLKTSGGTEVLNGLTNASGVVVGSFSGATPASIDSTVSGVKAGSGPTPYAYFELGGSIGASGYDQTALLSED